MGEQGCIVTTTKPYTHEINIAAIPKRLRSTNEVLQQSLNQVHTFAGLSYDTVHSPQLGEVAMTYKSFKVSKKNSIQRHNDTVPITRSLQVQT